MHKNYRCCGNCLYFRLNTCRFNPPVRFPRAFSEYATPKNRERDETIMWGWPFVDEDDWCGKYLNKEVL